MAHHPQGLTGAEDASVWRTLGRLIQWVRSAAPTLARQLTTLTVFYVFATLASLVSLAAVLAAMGVGSDRVGTLGGMVRDALSGLSETQILVVVLLAYVSTMAAAAGARFAISVGASRLRETCLIKLRTDIFSALTQSRWQAQAAIADTDAFRILTEEAGRIASLVENAVQTVLALALLGCLLGAGLVVAPIPTLAGLAIGVVIVLALLPIRRQARRAGEGLVRAVARFHGVASSNMRRRKEIRAHNGATKAIEQFTDSAEQVSDAHHRVRLAEARSVLGFDVGLEFAIVLLVAAVALSQAQSGTMFLLLYFFLRGLQALRTAHSSWSSVLTGLPSFARAHAVSQEFERHRLPANASGLAAPPEAALEAAHVELKEVSVTYEGQARPAVSEVSMMVHPGEFVALVGPSGSGKTTLADVCAGIIAPDQGTRRVWSGTKPARVGYVGQAGALFPLTVRENLLWSAPHASETECWQALHAAHAGFVADLPEGLDTHVGETRSRFSGGEEKRILLGCALVRKPSLLVLDEATSQLDADSEAAIARTLVGLRGRCTILLVTHSSGILAVCDRVFEMPAGRLRPSR